MSPDPLLLAAIRAVARSADPETTLDELLEIALRASGADRAAAFLWDSEQGGLALAAARGYPDEDLPALESAAGQADHAIQLAAQERIQTNSEADPAGRVLSAFPIVVGRDGIEEPVGALAYEADGGPAPEVAERIAAIADLVAVIVDRARLATNAAERIDWAERVSNSDMLTGLANARTLGRVMELEIARSARQRSELTVAIFDVDGLTTYNDAAGRAAGDDVLREVSAVISETVRFVDTLARWGGDEFMLVAPGATGTTVVQRVLEAVAARGIGGEQKTTVSAGLARFPEDGTTSDDLIAGATAALRAAQAVGPGTMAEATHDGGNGNGASPGIPTGAAG
ncbi:MAG TPA: sensor domain-containing diguanylate cyclase [Candidatus Limnocylindria bacterium]|nr:sensor domain-containing diguanylate cyclase [Candidatus Limnocylindria bacterium]